MNTSLGNPTSHPYRHATFSGTVADFLAYLIDQLDIDLTMSISRHPAGKGLRSAD